MKLSLLVRFHHGETLPSFVSRLAWRNRCRYVQDFVQDMGLNWRSILKVENATVQKLSSLTGIETTNLARHSFKSDDGDLYRINGLVVAKKYMNRTNLRICLECITGDMREGIYDAHGRALWQLACVHACPKHKCMLVSLPSCNYPRNEHDFYGRIADHLADCSQLNLPSDSVAGAALGQYMQLRIDGKKTGNWLDGLDIDVAGRLCENLGLLLKMGPNRESTDIEDSILHEAGEIGYNICNQGVDAFVECLREIKRNSKTDRGGYYTDFGFFIRWLQRVTDAGRYERLLCIFRSFVFENYPTAKGEMVLGMPCIERKVHSWSSVALHYGMGIHKAYRMREALVTCQEDRRDFPVGKFHFEFTAAVNDLNRLQACKYLNISLSKFDDLETANFLKPSLNIDYIDKVYSIESLEKLLASLFANVRSDMKSLPSNLLNMHAACLKTSSRFVEILTLIQNGQLRKVYSNQEMSGINSLLICPDEVRSVMDLENDDENFIDRLGVKKRLRISQETAFYLVKHKVLKSYVYAHPRTGIKSVVVNNTEIDSFLETHTTLGLMANNIGTQAKHVISKLEKAKIDPIDFPTNLSRIYLRENVPSGYL